MEKRASSRKFFITVSEELIESLVWAPPQHWAVGHEPKLATYAFTPQEDMMPAKLKIRGSDKPVPGEVYRFHVSFEPKTPFKDARTGIDCVSRDMYVFRLYAHDVERDKYHGELRFFSFPIGTDPAISPRAPFLQDFTGIKEQGCVWIAAPDRSYRTRHEVQHDQLLFNGPVVVQIYGEEKRKPGAIAIRIGRDSTVYDRRDDRMSSFARVEHIRRNVGRRTFEFFNLRDVSVAELRDDPPEHVLTNDGLVAVEE